MQLPNIDHIPRDVDLDDDAALDEYIDYDELRERHRVSDDDDLATLVVIDGVPVVDEAKQDKLFGAIRKQFSKEGIRLKEKGGFTMPMEPASGDGKPKSKGFLIVDFASIADAEKALATFQGFKFDKSHTFLLNRLADVERYAEVPEAWDENKARAAIPPFKERGFLREWLLDPDSRDQLAVFNMETVSVLWNNRGKAPEVQHEREGWTEGYIAWSPLGSYLASVHRQGIALWGGKELERLNRYHHPGVRFLDVSPNEQYLVTFSPDALPVPQGDKPWGAESVGHHVVVWDIFSGRILRTFALTAEEIATKNVPWPLFKWSWDDKYFARIVGNGKLSVYETPSMALVDKKSISVPGITEFEWMPYQQDEEETNAAAGDKPAANTATAANSKAPSDVPAGKSPAKGGKKGGGQKAAAPAGKGEGAGGKKGAGSGSTKRNLAPPHVIAYFVPQTGPDQPAQLTMMAIPSRTILRSKQVFFGLGAKIHFHPQGDYLAFKVDRTIRSGRHHYTSLEVFRLCEKDFPADSIDIKETVCAFAWEPHGNRFALITSSDSPSEEVDVKAIMAGAPGKMTAHLYVVQAAVESRKGAAAVPGGVELIKAFERRTVNSIFWSPKGRFVVFAGLRNLQGVLEFYDVDAGTSDAVTGGSAGHVLKTTTEINGRVVTSSKEVEQVQMLATPEHHGSSDVAWDPTGRYVCTTVTMWAKGADNGFQIYDLKGSLLSKQNRERVKQVPWRPRPPTMLSRQKIRHVRKTIKSYAKEFEIQDANESSALSAQEIEDRRRKIDAWLQFRSQALLRVPAVEEVETVLEE